MPAPPEGRSSRCSVAPIPARRHQTSRAPVPAGGALVRRRRRVPTRPGSARRRAHRRVSPLDQSGCRGRRGRSPGPMGLALVKSERGPHVLRHEGEARPRHRRPPRSATRSGPRVSRPSATPRASCPTASHSLRGSASRMSHRRRTDSSSSRRSCARPATATAAALARPAGECGRGLRHLPQPPLERPRGRMGSPHAPHAVAGAERPLRSGRLRPRADGSGTPRPRVCRGVSAALEAPPLPPPLTRLGRRAAVRAAGEGNGREGGRIVLLTDGIGTRRAPRDLRAARGSAPLLTVLTGEGVTRGPAQRLHPDSRTRRHRRRHRSLLPSRPRARGPPARERRWRPPSVSPAETRCIRDVYARPHPAPDSGPAVGLDRTLCEAPSLA